MDYLDSAKEFRQRILLYVGYILIAVAIVIATLILVYQAYGFGVTKNGTVIQNGLIFFSSQPSSANIYLNGQLRTEKTNSRIILPSGVYQVKLTSSGYRDWNRTIILDGGTVEHFDYPLLIPTKLSPERLQTYASSPGLMTQSPDKRWLLIGRPGSDNDFELYDLKDPTHPVSTNLSLPSGVLSKATSGETLKLVEWADDNQHVLLEHNYDSKSEFILVDINNAAQSVNLNNTLDVSPTQLNLINKKYDSYYSYDQTSATIKSTSLSNPTPVTVVDHVLAYKSYSNDTLLYATDLGAPAGKVLVKLKSANVTYTIRSLPISSNYLLDLTTYSGSLYVAAGASSDNAVYVYEDPIGQLTNLPNQKPLTSWILHVDQPNYLSFSNNAQFIMTENANSYAVYDIENKAGYVYKDPIYPLDSPQTNVSWMDGDRVTYVSGGKLIISEYDNNNTQSLFNASSSFIPAFSSDYKYIFTIGVNASGEYVLDKTSLVAS